jgi:hypothetical protein
MSGFDDRGPTGQGPMRGRRRRTWFAPGCRGYGYYRDGSGFSHGWRHRFLAGEVSNPFWRKERFASRFITPETEIETLRKEAAFLEQELTLIQQKIDEVNKNKNDS